jgi:hypothetical protein
MIIAGLDKKKPQANPRNNFRNEGNPPNAIISPIITHIPAAIGSSGRINLIKPLIFLQFIMKFSFFQFLLSIIP